MLCNHTYLRWSGNKAVCAVCGERFDDYLYTDVFVGTFVGAEFEAWRRANWYTAANSVNSTFTVNRFYPDEL